MGVPEYGRPPGNEEISLPLVSNPDGVLFSTFREKSLFQPSGINFLKTRFFWVTLAGGFLMGLLSVSVGGCVLRQHVLLAQGNMDALFYLIGFYICVAVYYMFLQPLFVWIYG